MEAACGEKISTRGDEYSYVRKYFTYNFDIFLGVAKTAQIFGHSSKSC